MHPAHQPNEESPESNSVEQVPPNTKLELGCACVLGKLDYLSVECGLGWDAMDFPKVLRPTNASPGIPELLTAVRALTRVWFSVCHVPSVA